MWVSGVTNNFEHILDASDSKESACNAGDPGSIPRSGRSPGEGNGYPLQDSCLGNPMDREAWWTIVHEARETECARAHTHTHTHTRTHNAAEGKDD